LDKKGRLNKIHKKIKHLNHTMIVWAEDNKFRGEYDDYIIPSRDGVEWKDDFKFVSKLDRLLSDGIDLKPNELKMCNELYKFYSQMYMKNILRK